MHLNIRTAMVPIRLEIFTNLFTWSVVAQGSKIRSDRQLVSNVSLGPTVIQNLVVLAIFLVAVTFYYHFFSHSFYLVLVVMYF